MADGRRPMGDVRCAMFDGRWAMGRWAIAMGDAGPRNTRRTPRASVRFARDFTSEHPRHGPTRPYPDTRADHGHIDSEPSVNERPYPHTQRDAGERARQDVTPASAPRTHHGPEDRRHQDQKDHQRG